jgi:hypothetical protein
VTGVWVWWDGKLVVTWFFIEQVTVKRTSKNQPAGFLEIKSVPVGQKEMEDVILDNCQPLSGNLGQVAGMGTKEDTHPT